MIRERGGERDSPRRLVQIALAATYAPRIFSGINIILDTDGFSAMAEWEFGSIRAARVIPCGF